MPSEDVLIPTGNGWVYSTKDSQWLRVPGWTPTPENINALPKPLRDYIHELGTMCDPSGIIRENMILKDTITALDILHREKCGEIVSVALTALESIHEWGFVSKKALVLHSRTISKLLELLK